MKNNIKSLSSYIIENCTSAILNKSMNESINNRDMDRAIKLIKDFLYKRGIYICLCPEILTIDGRTVYSYGAFSNATDHGCIFFWDRADTSELAGILFIDSFNEYIVALTEGDKYKNTIKIDAKGASIVRMVQLIADVLNGKISMDIDSISPAIRDAQIWESLETSRSIIVESNDPVVNALEKKKMAVYMKVKNWERKGNHTEEEVNVLKAELDDIKRQLTDARISVKANATVQRIPDPSIQKIEKRFEEEERATPEERFEDMESYITNVILGINTSALISGAPGIGKSYRVEHLLKKEGKVRGTDYELIKGKCTPMVLYTLLHDYQKKGQILVIDDADAVVTDDTSIQLIKAATDSSEERVVAYASSSLPKVPEEKLGLYDDFVQDAKGNWVYPKNFVYEGGIIILTNMSAGQIDTAIRSRALICDLSFTTDELLELIEKLAPHVKPEVLSQESKEKAMAYLRKMAEDGAPMDLSIRGFALVAEMYMSNAPEKSIQRRVREQMRLRYLRGGKKY